VPQYALIKDFPLKPEENCVGGQFCAFDPDATGPANGKHIVEEILRQLCIFQVQPRKWWDYFTLFDQQCN